MGWDFYTARYYNKDGKIEVKKEVYDLLNWCSKTKIYKPLKIVKNNNVVYAAVEQTDLKTNIVDMIYADVFLIEINMKEKYNFGYKEIPEFSHPCYYDCPQSILNIITPTENENASEWRKKCVEILKIKLEYKRLYNQINKLPLGSEISINFKNRQVKLVKKLIVGRKYPVWCNDKYLYSKAIIVESLYKIA